jgi:hypothetical protein
MIAILEALVAARKVGTVVTGGRIDYEDIRYIWDQLGM